MWASLIRPGNGNLQLLSFHTSLLLQLNVLELDYDYCKRLAENITTSTDGAVFVKEL